MSNNVTIGNVYFKENEGIHVNRFSDRETSKEIHGFGARIRTRLAYLIVSDEESKEINGLEWDKERILKTVKEKYRPHLLEAIKEESKDLVLEDLQNLKELPIDKKLVKLTSLALTNTSVYGSILRTKGYNHAYDKKLKDSLKEKGETKTIASFPFTKNGCQEILEDEKRVLQEEKSGQAYIIISMSYVYNIIKSSKTQELEVSINAENTTASFMPELIVEYGVFFDGTNNNMYNIDFYKNFREFLKEPAEAIEKNKGNADEGSKRQTTGEYNSIQEYIYTEENPQISDEVIKLIISQMNEAPQKIRYFDDESNLSVEDEDVLESSKAEHAKDVFNYLVDVKQGSKDTDELTRGKYVREKILPSKNDSSYVNGESNINRLYSLYDGEDVRNNKDEEGSVVIRIDDDVNNGNVINIYQILIMFRFI